MSYPSLSLTGGHIPWSLWCLLYMTWDEGTQRSTFQRREESGEPKTLCSWKPVLSFLQKSQICSLTLTRFNPAMIRYGGNAGAPSTPSRTVANDEGAGAHAPSGSGRGRWPGPAQPGGRQRKSLVGRAAARPRPGPVPWGPSIITVRSVRAVSDSVMEAGGDR